MLIHFTLYSTHVSIRSFFHGKNFVVFSCSRLSHLDILRDFMCGLFDMMQDVFMDITNRSRKKVKSSKSSKAGLSFPVGRIHRYLRKGKYANRISPSASVYMTAVMEYLVYELFSLAGSEARIAKKSRIIPRHLLLAIVKDEEMKKLLTKTVLSQGGVDTSIQNALNLSVK
ncbi:unnamed protein product [Nezara viridula]|uniref:Histone H2A n=1 Tax=Nezara viridula TaxID=85310 RepID=A0A9P0MTV2_NEZVI|nr:unnamed protein product [Nezara viridula]